ncbi:tRNA1(Val) (adenine(37)-N6)-methyltransferase [Aestuariivivens sediminicola]|uniref:tRNA1(Val) (adenine(37)-N6)-methyltransferase n=1 Tax=Aestuariivivens sediminicola TaxID=2913560 RepID=UPI001F576B3A|nr:methyltransferase [Aestuariivivens sediminicola]
MKIGTDAVLLGAWTPIKHQPHSILDIGTGTGILSLMLAQRTQAKRIDAIEIDKNAHEQCVENFENSGWNHRLNCYHSSVIDFTADPPTDTVGKKIKYGLIVCNPPFFSAEYKTNSNPRNIARFRDALPFDQLVACVSKLLHPEGVFSVIIPYQVEDQFVNYASKHKLYPNAIVHVKGTKTTKTIRSLIAFSFRKSKPQPTELIIEIKRHEYSREYIDLTKEFYLKM